MVKNLSRLTTPTRFRVWRGFSSAGLDQIFGLLATTYVYKHICMYVCMYVCMYIYIYWCYYLGQVWPFEVLLSGPSLFITKHCLSKNNIKIGVSAFFFEKNCARKFEVLLSGPSWPFLRCSQLGPDNNTYLAQIITPQNALFFCFFCF